MEHNGLMRYAITPGQGQHPRALRLGPLRRQAVQHSSSAESKQLSTPALLLLRSISR